MNSIIHLAFAVAALAGSVTGARIKEHAAGEQAGHPEFTVEEAQLKTHGGHKIRWSMGDRFICVLKWEKAQWGHKYTGKTCLANLDDVFKGQEVIEAARAKGKDTPLMKGTKDFNHCQSSKEPWTLKLCPLKGKSDVRLSYSSKVHVPKSAFFGPQLIGPTSKTLPMVKVAVDLNDLKKEMGKLPEGQASWKTENTLLVPKLAKPVEAPAETVTEEVQSTDQAAAAEDEPDEEEVEDNDNDEVIMEEAAGNFVDLDNLAFEGKLNLWAERDDGRVLQPGRLVTGGAE
jgi:hypothetical protein